MSAVTTGVPAREAMDSALVALRAAGVDSPRLDAELLLAEALGVRREELLTGDHVVAGPAVRRFQDLVRRRAMDREPVAYLLGRRAFRNLDLAVDPRALIPRPETELLVELAVAGLPQGARVVDVGTGSGAIALALVDERADLGVTGSDVDAGALAVARSNGERLGLDVEWVAADGVPGAGCARAVSPGETRRAHPWDAVVANPPYVADGDALQPEIARHEPPHALRAGPEGLDVLRMLATQTIDVPFVALEHGAGQGAAVRDLLGSGAATHRDLAGHERVTVRC
jgi:release factor glutamine methyltransferase